MRELGYVEGQNLIIESRWAESRYDWLPALMADVVGRKVDVLVTYGTPAVIAAKNATSTVPIVVVVMGHPVGSGVAASLAHPGGNLTGPCSLWWAQRPTTMRPAPGSVRLKLPGGASTSFSGDLRFVAGANASDATSISLTHSSPVTDKGEPNVASIPSAAVVAVSSPR